MFKKISYVMVENRKWLANIYRILNKNIVTYEFFIQSSYCSSMRSKTQPIRLP